MGAKVTKRGNVFVASATSIGIRFRFQRVGVEETIKLAPTPRNLAHARNLRGRIMDEIARGTFNYAARFPNSPRAARFDTRPAGAKDTVAVKLRGPSARGFRNPRSSITTIYGHKTVIENFLIPAFGDTPIADLKPSAIRKWIAGLKVSKRRISNMLQPLRAICAEAFADELIDANPVSSIKVKRKREVDTKKVDPFTPNERAAILAELDGQVRNYFQVALWTGMRTSELIGLQWSEVDFARGVIHVKQAFVLGEMKGTKTPAGERDIKILPAALVALKAQREHTLLQGESVFHNHAHREGLGRKQAHPR